MHPETASLKDLMEYMEIPAIHVFRAYFDRQTARMVAVGESVMTAIEEGRNVPASVADDTEEIETAEEIVNDKTGRFIQPPDKSLFDENHYKARFANNVRDPRVSAKLARALKRGIFRIFSASFSSVLYKFDLEEQWYKYLADAKKQFVIQWAKQNNLPYEDDLKIDRDSDLS